MTADTFEYEVKDATTLTNPNPNHNPNPNPNPDPSQVGYLQLSATSLQLVGLEMLLLCSSAAALARPGHTLAQAS